MVNPIGALVDDKKSGSAPFFTVGIGKHEIRNSKQIEKFKNYNVSNSVDRLPGFGFFDFEMYLA